MCVGIYLIVANTTIKWQYSVLSLYLQFVFISLRSRVNNNYNVESGRSLSRLSERLFFSRFENPVAPGRGTFIFLKFVDLTFVAIFVVIYLYYAKIQQIIQSDNLGVTVVVVDFFVHAAGYSAC